jgi:hypothetical protein
VKANPKMIRLMMIMVFHPKLFRNRAEKRMLAPTPNISNTGIRKPRAKPAKIMAI